MLLRILFLICCLWESAAAGGPYRISTTPWMGWTYLDVAQAKGFWKAQGVDVLLDHHPDGDTYLDALLSRRVDFSCGMVGDMAWIHTQVAPVAILAETGWSVGGDKFVLAKGLSLSSMTGKPVGVYQKTYALPYFLKHTLGREFRFLSSSNFVPMTPADIVSQMRAGRLQAAILYEPFASALSDKTHVVCTSADRPGCIPEGIFCFKDTLARIPEKDLVALLRGIFQAIAWMGDPKNDRELLDIVNRGSFRNQPIKDLATLRELKAGAPTHSRPRLVAQNRAGGGLHGFLLALRQMIATLEPSSSLFKPEEVSHPGLFAKAIR